MVKLNDWIMTCRDCGFQSSTLEPAEGTGIPGLEDLRRENFKRLLDRIEAHKPLKNARVLEVGSAWGWFLEAAAERGAVVQGIEPEKANADLARTKGLSVESGFFPNDLMDRGPFDIIVFNDVFEHIPSPSKIIQDVEALLKPNGLAVFNYPSSKGMLFRIANLLSSAGLPGPLARLWQVGLPSPHISYFSANNLNGLVQRNTKMIRIDQFPLKTVSRVNLRGRIGASHLGIKGLVLYLSIWLLSFVLPILPSDIEVSIFRTRS
jgi:SAM-dependent methyltransferase